MSLPTALYTQLKSLVPTGQTAPTDANLKTAQETLRKLKLELVQSSASSPADPAHSSYLQLQRDTLELACFLSLYQRDTKSFERYMVQLKVYYTDYASRCTESANQGPLYGLYLLYLLAQNHIAEFHTEYELLCHNAVSSAAHSASGSSSGPFVPPSPTSASAVSSNALLSSAYIRYPIQLESQLMEGCYNQILTAKAAVPLPLYSVFMDVLTQTVRSKIADCSELAYRELPLKELQKILMLSSEEETVQFVAARKGWSTQNKVVTFGKNASGNAKDDIPALKIIKQTLDYATELERIV